MADSSVTLFKMESDDIRVSIEAYFENGFLVIDGYDIGKRVEEYWGDSDYEYVTKIPAEGIVFLYHYFNISEPNEQLLLSALASRYNSNACYSDIRKLLDDNMIVYESFSWT